MKKRNYTHVQALLPEIKAMLAEGKTQREVAEHYGFQDSGIRRRDNPADSAAHPHLPATVPGSESCGFSGHAGHPFRTIPTGIPH